MQKDTSKTRIDKWMWAARFYRTRSIARAAIQAGKVKYNGQKCKAGKLVEIGANIQFRAGFDDKEVIVIALREQRGSASIALGLYEETEDSLNKRKEAQLQRKALAGSDPTPKQRPTKKQRRQIKMLQDLIG
jgi:ribosome-associated heat shock protein Hsp15